MSAPSHPLIAALSTVLADAGVLLRIPAEDVVVERIEGVDWPDSCLGVADGDEACAQVVTPGYRIRLGDGLVYHADQRGNVRLARGGDPQVDTEIRLSYTVLGGIGGWSTTFETDSTQLTDAQEQELRRLINEADFFNVPNVEATTIVMDGFTRRLWIAVGRRNHEVVRGDGIEANDTEAFRALVVWAEARTPPIFPRAEDSRAEDGLA